MVRAEVQACQMGIFRAASDRFQWHNAGRTLGPSPATVASANRFSRVAEGFLNQLMLSPGKLRSAEYER